MFCVFAIDFRPAPSLIGFIIPDPSISLLDESKLESLGYSNWESYVLDEIEAVASMSQQIKVNIGHLDSVFEQTKTTLRSERYTRLEVVPSDSIRVVDANRDQSLAHKACCFRLLDQQQPTLQEKWNDEHEDSRIWQVRQSDIANEVVESRRHGQGAQHGSSGEDAVNSSLTFRNSVSDILDHQSRRNLERATKVDGTASDVEVRRYRTSFVQAV